MAVPTPPAPNNPAEMGNWIRWAQTQIISQGNTITIMQTQLNARR